jgi:hypothetical protein
VCRFDDDGRCTDFTEWWIRNRTFANAASAAAASAAAATPAGG